MNNLTSVSSTKPTVICTISSGTTTQAGRASSSTVTMKLARRIPGKQREARLPSSARRLLVMTQCHLLVGRYAEYAYRQLHKKVGGNEFKPKGSVRMATEWLEWLAHKERIHIRHQLNNTEKHIGDRKLPVDGFHSPSQTIRFKDASGTPMTAISRKEKSLTRSGRNPWLRSRKKPEPKVAARSKGYKVVEMCECEWLEIRKTNRELQRLIATEVRQSLDVVKIMSLERILSEVRNGRLFGWVEVDLKDKFSEMCPIFKNINISRDDIGEYMKAQAEEHEIMAQPLRSLIGSMKGEKVLLATPLT